MKKLTTLMYVICAIVVLSFTSLSSQTPPNNSEISKIQDDSLIREIQKVYEENEKTLEEVKELKEKNTVELKKVAKLETEKKKLFSSVSTKVLRLISAKKSKNTVITSKSSKKIIIKPLAKNNKLDLSKVKTDSVCTKTNVNKLFVKEKCTKWDYFKVLVDNNGEEIRIKMDQK